MSGIYSMSGPTYRGATRQEMFDAAMEQPLSLTSTLVDQAKGGVLESFGLGTAIREGQLPEEAPTVPGITADPGERDFLKSRLETPQELGLRRQSMGALDEDQYKASAFFRKDIPYDPGMTEARAEALASMDDAKKVREFYAQKRPFSAFIGNLAGQAFDPINYVPVAGPLVKAAAVAKAGRIGGGAIHAGVDAAANTAAFGIATSGERAKFGDDVSWQATVSQIATAALIGSAFGAIGGAVGRRVDARLITEAEQRLSTLKTTMESRLVLNEGIDAMAHGEDIKLSPNATEPMARIQQEVRSLQSSNSLNLPDAPTKDIMASKSRVESVPLSMVRGTQSKMDWDMFGRGEHPGPLIDGYGDKPVAVRREDGEYLVFDGHHRTALAASEGKTAIDMHVVDAKDYAPASAGRKPSKQQGMSDDELLRELGAEPGATSTEPPASWVIRDKVTQSPVMETFNKRLLDRLNTEKYEAVPIKQHLVELNQRVKAGAPVDASAPRTDHAPDGIKQAEASVAKPDDSKALAAQYRVDPQTGSFPEEAEVAQLSAEGRLTEEDALTMAQAQSDFETGSAYAEALKSVAGCLL